ncbi:hypothetical protein KIPB_001385 [Kipferlia bialata]|uniref:Uncharacterized protein n=1 Tax=Kipferlia bialata TaxID=797122 RepID=A0A391NS14_9EUKA|nr:hypothetical protein KIPB_001385 [Kipferlia bialata]|eukprot:g1385.t1
MERSRVAAEKAEVVPTPPKRPASAMGTDPYELFPPLPGYGFPMTMGMILNDESIVRELAKRLLPVVLPVEELLHPAILPPKEPDSEATEDYE